MNQGKIGLAGIISIICVYLLYGRYYGEKISEVIVNCELIACLYGNGGALVYAYRQITSWVKKVYFSNVTKIYLERRFISKYLNLSIFNSLFPTTAEWSECMFGARGQSQDSQQFFTYEGFLVQSGHRLTNHSTNLVITSYVIKESAISDNPTGKMSHPCSMSSLNIRRCKQGRIQAGFFGLFIRSPILRLSLKGSSLSKQFITLTGPGLGLK